MITKGHGCYFKTDFKFPGGHCMNCNSASGVRDSFVTFVDYLDICYKHTAKYKTDIDDFLKVR